MKDHNQFTENERFQKKNTKKDSFIKPVKPYELTSGASKKELTETLNKMNKLKGEKKEDYMSELVSKENSIAFASDLVKVLESIISYNHKLDQEIVKNYQKTIDHLFKRLDKLSGPENKFEIELIYKEIDKLNNNMQKMSDDWKDILKVVVTGVFALVGIAVHQKSKNN